MELPCVRKRDKQIEQIRNKKVTKNRTHSLYLKFAVKISTLLQTRVAQILSTLPVFVKVSIFLQICCIFNVIT